jgi:hypothetical protein
LSAQRMSSFHYKTYKKENTSHFTSLTNHHSLAFLLNPSSHQPLNDQNLDSYINIPSSETYR